MDLPGKGVSYWLDSAPTTSFPVQEGDLAVDVAILGGGIVGVTVGFLLKEAGVRVALVEARRVLEGVTGHTTGKLTSLHALIYRSLIDRFDRERAYEQNPPLPYHTLGAACFQNQARFHPRKYLLALANAIPGNGSYILEQTTVLDVDDGRPAIVTTNHGKIRAHDVIVATHFPFLDRGLYFTRQTPRLAYVLGGYVVEPVPEGLFISTQPDYHSLRPQPTSDGMMLIAGGGEHVTGQGGDTRQYYRDLDSWVHQHFHVRSIAYRWSTQDNYTVDGLPFVGKYTPVSSHLYVATGFFGWGMTNGTAAALLLADTILGRPNPWAAVYDPSRVWRAKTLFGAARRGTESAGQLVTPLATP